MAGATVRADEPFLTVRARPIYSARQLWASVSSASSAARLGMDSDGKRLEFVTEPKTGLRLPGEAARRTKPVTPFQPHKTGER